MKTGSNEGRLCTSVNFHFISETFFIFLVSCAGGAVDKGIGKSGKK